MDILYRRKNDLNIFKVDLLYAVGNKVRMVELEPYGNDFITQLDISDGEYRYKFVLNEGIRMNDPDAFSYIECNDGEVWSIMKVLNGQMIINKNDNLEIDNFVFQGGKTIVYPRNRSCHLKFDLKNVTGTHSVTTLWYQPDGSLYHIEEAKVNSPLKKSVFKESFWINLEQKERSFGYGIWVVEIYLDGCLSKKDYFNVLQNNIYKTVNIYNYSI